MRGLSHLRTSYTPRAAARGKRLVRVAQGDVGRVLANKAVPNSRAIRLIRRFVKGF
jgi:hypothetical protein